MPDVNASTALTLVRQFPSFAPSGSSLGRPSLRMPMSVVVPPTSTMMASFSPVNALEPMIDAAGPERIVSTGRSLATDSSMREPSPFTIMRGAEIPVLCCTFFREVMRSVIIGIRRALRTAVMVLSLKPKAEDSSCPHTTGRSVALLISSFTAISCSGFRTLRYDDMAKASTLFLTDSTNSLAPSMSSSAFLSPWRLWPPSSRTISSTGTLAAASCPMTISPTRHPFPSTTELVARVDDMPITRMHWNNERSSFPMAFPMPIERSLRVVSDLAELSTAPLSMSRIAASVYVPPVSIPSP